ncbi:MAG: phospho-N-acetylmuramoyl-pentapeptide-transferase [Firmicutes bacterium]|nr:phospho-N-acetylmuramoyl-pentapeptide-transferase [Bacillota bacterium]
MLLLAKAALALMVSFLTAVVFGFILIPFLKKLKVKQRVSVFLQNKHKGKDGTPTMGGLIFIIPAIIAIIVLILMNKIEWTDNLFIILFVFLSYALLGFIDDYLIIKRNNNEGLTEIQKLLGQILIAVVFFIIFMKSGRSPVLDIHTLGIKIDLGWFYGLFILFVLVASSNAVNLTDGLDGLAGGLSTIAFIAFGIISFGSTWISGNQDIGIFCFILVGALLGFLVYNTHPAKVFMGDTGSLALGATLASVAILTSHEVTLIVVAGVFVFETVCSLIQMIAGRYFNKKVFLMAPFHHHLEKLGWQETDIVKLFWIIGMVLGMTGIYFGVWL